MQISYNNNNLSYTAAYNLTSKPGRSMCEALRCPARYIRQCTSHNVQTYPMILPNRLLGILVSVAMVRIVTRRIGPSFRCTTGKSTSGNASLTRKLTRGGRGMMPRVTTPRLIDSVDPDHKWIVKLPSRPRTASRTHCWYTNMIIPYKICLTSLTLISLSMLQFLDMLFSHGTPDGSLQK